MRSGEQCVMMDGLTWMPMLSVGNWDIHDTVSFHGLASHKCMHLPCVLLFCLLFCLFVCLLPVYFFEFVKSLSGHLMKQ